MPNNNQLNADPTLSQPTTLEEWRDAFLTAQREIRELKDVINSLQPRRSYSPADADEEEALVARETDWILQKNKKRKYYESPEKKNNNQNIKQNVPKQYKPPPVVVSEVKDYNLLNLELKKKNLGFRANMLNNNQVKINVDTEHDYRILTKFMNDDNHLWHTYENKQVRPIRVIARNLHPTCKVDEIKQELLVRGFKILEVVNKIKKTKENNKEVRIPLPIFMLTFDHGEDIKKIFGIEFLCHMRIKIEAVRSNKLIAQCKRCQRFGHTQKFCGREAKCVKCAGNHLTVECKKPANTKPVCANCSENHPANYRGCTIAKELQKRRDNVSKTKMVVQKKQPSEYMAKRTSNSLSYAGAVHQVENQIQANDNSQTNISQPEQHILMQMMQNLLAKFDTQEKTMLQFSQRLSKLENNTYGASARKLN